MPRILLVEDNEEIRDSLSRRLQRRGFDVVTAGDGSQGLAMAKSENPALVLMDMNMPVMDGWHASRMIKADSLIEHIPIIGLTAHAMTGDREKAIAAGCVDYHTKPIDFAQLIGQIESVLKQNAAE